MHMCYGVSLTDEVKGELGIYDDELTTEGAPI